MDQPNPKNETQETKDPEEDQQNLLPILPPATPPRHGRLEPRAIRTRHGYVWRVLARSGNRILTEGLPQTAGIPAVYLICTPPIDKEDESFPKEIIPEPKTWEEPVIHHKTDAVEKFIQETQKVPTKGS